MVHLPGAAVIAVAAEQRHTHPPPHNEDSVTTLKSEEPIHPRR
jgi:hypothetical protein